MGEPLTPEALAAPGYATFLGWQLDDQRGITDATAAYRWKYLRHDERRWWAHFEAEAAALTGQLAVMTAARDDLARQLDKALKEQDRYRAALEAISADSAPNLVNPSADIAREALEAPGA